ncbi:GNAT family N-acetyltransferase [Microbacterium capsulatum]|uniref:GNAT family N-acetyltransferase n=1 Tax=Microbacterium capsulatum TaxID=3041921 RepID=A0ABU0XDM9_9MICO|nr:GNAT family N-acetyltransferase [Microbacterium sp. ASV81]MDQ4213222.1 GNAT family N-acetyltransferase [Microbacterium sp. ASV81]
MMTSETRIPLPAGATLHPLVLPADAARMRAYADARNRCLTETTGRDDDHLDADGVRTLLASDADMRRRAWSVELDGRMVGVAHLNVALDGDGTTAEWHVSLYREVQGRGIGSAAAAHIDELARADGVRELQTWAEQPAGDAEMLPAPTGFGGVPHDRVARFLLASGHSLEQVYRISEYTWTPGSVDRLTALRADAEAHSADYRVVGWMLPTPPRYVPGYAWMKSRMSTDAPSAGLDTPEEVWDAGRVARHDRRWADMGFDLQVTAAEHLATGELCAFNELGRRGPADSVTLQNDTLVLSAHRGHRLGLLVKTAGMLNWRDRFPLSDRIITYNAEENRPMLSINETIGFEAIAYEGAWKKDLR